MASKERGHLYLVTDSHQGPLRDEELVAAFLRDEASASAQIWERYYPTVRRVVCRSLGPAPGPAMDVDDTVQEVFIRLYRKLPSLREPAALRSFVLAITVHVVQGERRFRWVKRWLAPFDDGQLPDREGPAADLDAREALKRFYGILDGLALKHRTAFILRHVEGLELVDVAQALGVSLATIKRWLPRITQRVFAQVRRDPSLAPYLASGGAAFVVTK